MRFLLLFIGVLLFADININVYVDENFTKNLPNPFLKQPFKGDFNKRGFYILSYEKLPLLIENNLSIISALGHEKTYLLSHKNLNEIKTVANADLPVKILFDVIGDVKYVKGTLEDFKKGKIDAITLHKKIYVKDSFYYDMDKMGLGFSKYYIAAKPKYLKKHKDLANFLSVFFKKGSTNSSVVLTAYYLRKRVKLSSVYNDMVKEAITKKLKVAVTPYWPPFELSDKGELRGIGIDFWKLIAKKADLDYEIIAQPIWIKILNGIKVGKYDITPNTSETPDRKKYAVFSKPYVKFPLAIACRNDVNVNRISDIKSIAVGYNYTAHKMMKAHYPDLRYVPAKSVIDAFELVQNRKAQCVVDVLPTVVWLINQKNIGDMRVYFKTPFTFNLQVMLRKDMVKTRDKINRAIDEISVYDKNRIISKYIGEKVLIEEKNFNPFGYVIIFLLGIAVIFIFYKAKSYKEKSEYDALTKIYNRGTIQRMFAKKAKESHGSIIFFDIDHFKDINDTYGHKKGDVVLAKLARIIEENIRKSDYFGRWGGEEFVIILPEETYETTFKIAEKLRKIVETSDFEGLKITISLGVTDYKKGEDINEVLKRADDALYEAKNKGRNQVRGKKNKG